VAEMMSNHVEFVIGHRDKLPDASALGFSKAFYLALAKGASLEDSFIAGSGLEETSYHLWATRSNPGMMFFVSDKRQVSKRFTASLISLHASLLAFSR